MKFKFKFYLFKVLYLHWTFWNNELLKNNNTKIKKYTFERNDERSVMEPATFQLVAESFKMKLFN